MNLPQQRPEEAFCPINSHRVSSNFTRFHLPAQDFEPKRFAQFFPKRHCVILRRTERGKKVAKELATFSDRSIQFNAVGPPLPRILTRNELPNSLPSPSTSQTCRYRLYESLWKGVKRIVMFGCLLPHPLEMATSGVVENGDIS